MLTAGLEEEVELGLLLLLDGAGAPYLDLGVGKGYEEMPNASGSASLALVVSMSTGLPSLLTARGFWPDKNSLTRSSWVSK